jgi:hypothetical protein
MTDKQAGLELIQRYVYQVGEFLPSRQRGDVMAELRSLLEEGVEERARTSGRTVDEELTAAFLLEFGEPSKVAERYGGEPRYLIGPRIFPVFLLVLKISLAVISAACLAGFVFSAMAVPPWGPAEFWHVQALLSWLWRFAQTALVNIAILIFAFALIERFLPPTWRPKRDWDPRKLPLLPPEAERDQVKRAVEVIRIYGLIFLAAVLNFYPQWFGIVSFTDSGVLRIPFKDLGVYLPVPLIDLGWALTAALSSVLIVRGRWERWSRWAEFAVGLYDTVVVWLILTHSELNSAQATSAGRKAWVAFNNQSLPFEWLSRVIYIALVVILLGTLVKTGKRLYRLLRARTA